MGKCIYCLRPNKFIKSHVVPECLGSNIILKNSVCAVCDNKIGIVEAKVCNELSFYRLITQVKSKGKYATSKAELNVFGQKIPARISRGGIKGYVRPIIEDGPPRYFHAVAETQKKLKKLMKKYTKTGIEFNEERISEVEVKVVFRQELTNINSMDFLRVAAKIAFERFCMKRYSQAFDKEFNPVREFVLNGNRISRQVAFLIFDNELANNILDISCPYHGILLFGAHNKIASIVNIFGLFYYYIILNNNVNYLINDWEEFVYIDPKTKKDREPLYHSFPNFPQLELSIERSLRDSNVFRKSTNYAREKFNLFLKQIVNFQTPE